MNDSTATTRMTRQTLGDLLRRTAARFPDKTAICCGEVTRSDVSLVAPS